MKKVKELNSRLKNDYEEISEKYAEMIGHQNPKQRIKHVAQLKDKIYQLEQVCFVVAVLLYSYILLYSNILISDYFLSQ